MKSPAQVLSSLLLCVCVAVPVATASGAEPQAAASAAINAEADQATLRFEQEQRELAEFNARSDAYWAGVGERLLLGQASPGECPPSPEASTCLLAARLLQSSDRQRADALLRSAAARSLDDSQALWMLARGSLGNHGGDIADRALAELRRREPENLLVWLHSLSGERWTPERVQMAARSTRFDTYLYDFLRADLRKLVEYAEDAPRFPEARAMGLDAVDSAQLMLFGYLTAEAFPGSLVEVCTADDTTADATLRSDCWQIAERMVEQADSIADLGSGWSLMRRSALTEPQLRQLDTVRSQLEYLQFRLLELDEDSERARAYLRHLREEGATEISALRAGLAEAGLPESVPPSLRAPSE